MNRSLVALLVAAMLPGWMQVAHASSCSCTAPDRSCSASITCSNGCWSACASGGSCSAGCGGSGDGGGIDFQNLSFNLGPAEPFSWSAGEGGEGVLAADLSQRASEHFGFPFAYVPNDPNGSVNVDLKGLSFADLRRLLAQRGTVATADRQVTRWTRPESAPATRYSLRADNAPVARIGEALGQVSSGAFRLAPGNPQARMAVDCKGVTASDLTRIFADTEHPPKP